MSFDFIQDKHKKVHFIGIGGISMSGLAEILIKNGFKVSGSDRSSSPITEKLESMGVEIFYGHKSENIKDADLIVFTAAISSDNPEIIKAKELNMPLMDRAEFLGNIMKGHKYNVAVSGTHGKTTTTSMMSHILLEANVDPTILVGGQLEAINGNVRTGESEYFLTEACEYKASFLKFFPYIGVILNIEEDHLDFYRDLEEIKNTFLKFISLIPDDGYLVANYDDPVTAEICKQTNCNILSFGINNGDVRAKNIHFDKNGCPSFKVFKENTELFTINLNVPGTHNILNALASICAGLCLNIPYDSILKGIESFKGTHRRFEIKGVKNGVTVIDDYAHHPTEIKAALNATKNYPHNKIYCVFQPHTYTRTISLFNNFAESFFNCDELILADIYAAREKDPGNISSQMLSDKINEKGVKCSNIHNFEDIVAYLQPILCTGDILLTVGAGDIFKVGEIFLNK
ncbi:UDP-N-acetylmuramate--L-alanine ligase [Clostridium sp. KNHs214]|uniref:UDP-N-acetylmuramate--L-alanine ligase n=1 Tax=Clostridium sp. KNHs214 TaxID=1540257 RepID=UPI000556D1A5|nr:UDP-N-acetylmuramate--L-alanine ligase [Clostridium sp. KNHs214]